MADSSNSDRATLSTRLAELPDLVLPRVRRGFEVLGTLKGEQRTSQIGKIFAALVARSRPSPKEIARSLGIPLEDAQNLLLSVSVTFGALVDISASAEEFVKFGSGKIFPESESESAKWVATSVVEKRPEFQKAYEVSALADSILPSLEDFDLEIDVRVRFADGKVERSSPLAVVHISTDVDGEDLWFQMNKQDLKELIEKLKKAEGDIGLAEEFMKSVAQK